ncbi:unnamed protein product [Musa textilis]
MLAEEEIDFPSFSGSNICRRFYSRSKNRIYDLPVPKCQGRFYCGSYDGWIAKVGKDSRMHRVNITGGGVELPSLYAFGTPFRQCCNLSPEPKRSLFVTKVCLSSSPSAGRDCLVVAFYDI